MFLQITINLVLLEISLATYYVLYICNRDECW